MLVRAIVTEKSTREQERGKYAFEVDRKATKPEIKKTVEKVFGVKVVRVQTLIVPGRRYRRGKKWTFAYKGDWKKAVVELKDGQKIDLFAGKGGSK